MPVDIAQIASDIAQAEVRVGEHLFAISFKPNMVTTGFMEDMAKGQQAADFLKKFCEVVVDWDVLENGERVPLEPERVVAVPIRFLRGIMESLIDETDSSKGKASKPSSDS